MTSKLLNLIKISSIDIFCYTISPFLVQVIAGPEDSPETLSFYAEPIYASLGNIITRVDEKEKDKDKITANKDYNFLEVELKYGVLQASFIKYMDPIIFVRASCLSAYLSQTKYIKQNSNWVIL